MKKNTYKNFGPIEISVIARLTYEKINIITSAELDKMFGFSPTKRIKLVSRLKKKKILSPIKKGVYIFSPLESGPNGKTINEMIIPGFYFPNDNYYIGYATMFNYYGFTEQIFQTVYVLNTAFAKDKVILGLKFKFIKINKSRMYGLKKIKISENTVIISDKEKTLLDLCYFNKPVGGVEQANNIVKDLIANNKINIKKFINYISKFPNITLRKRLGILLEKLNIKNSILQPILKSVQKTSINSLSDTRKGKLNKKWRVIVNDS